MLYDCGSEWFGCWLVAVDLLDECGVRLLIGCIAVELVDVERFGVRLWVTRWCTVRSEYICRRLCRGCTFAIKFHRTKWCINFLLSSLGLPSCVLPALCMPIDLRCLVSSAKCSYTSLFSFAPGLHTVSFRRKIKEITTWIQLSSLLKISTS